MLHNEHEPVKKTENSLMKHNNFIKGVSYLIRGFNLLTKTGIKRFVIIPLIINIILFSFLIGGGFHIINYLVSFLPHWLHWLSWLLFPIAFITFSIVLIYTFTIAANIIGAPFNSFLSEKVELIIKGQKPSINETWKDSLKSIPRTLKREAQKIIYFLPRAILLLILFIIPVINIAAGFLWFIFGCWMMAMQYIDYPMDNHKISFKEMYRYLRKNCLLSLSFGFAIVIAAMIPIINFFLMPAAVIGATLLWLENQ